MNASSALSIDSTRSMPLVCLSKHLTDTERTVLNTRVNERIAGQDLLEMIIPPQRFVSTLTGRLRGYPAYCAAKNTVFQGLAADGAKRAL